MHRKLSKRLLLLCLAFLLIVRLVVAQQPTPADSLSAFPDYLIAPIPVIPVGYDRYTEQQLTGAISTISMSDFNQGLISDPAQLIQGRMAGVQIYNRGGDPNRMSLIRIRGLSSFSSRTPLIVIDGVPGASLQSLDPNDLASMTVLKDGSAQAIYGIRASDGVILITTKSGSQTDKPLSVAYQGQLAVSTPYNGIPVMSADEFRRAGGIDLGASTNWMEEVQRNGISHTHGLALSGRKGNTDYRISGNYRDVEGVLRKSGFDQVNVRANVSSRFLQDDLELTVSAAYTDRNSQLGFNEAFRYAVSFNPTAPVYAEDAPFPFNEEQYGGYFQTIGLFDAFNPRALVDLNERNGRSQVLNASALLKYKVNANLSVNFRYAHQDQFVNERAYYSPQSYFRGNATSPFPERKGRADLYDVDDAFSLYELFVNHNKTFGKSNLKWMLGAAYQDGEHVDNYLQLSGFADRSILDVKRISDYSTYAQDAMQFDTINNGWNDRISAFFGRVHYNLDDKFFVNASLRYEGSSKLGDNNNWGLFPSVGAAVDIGRLMELPIVDLLKFRINYGVTGALPRRGGLSQQRIVLVQRSDSTFVPEVEQEANPDLKWEEKIEWNVGFDFQVGKVTGFVDWYTRKVSDWIVMDHITDGWLSFDLYDNKYALKTRGFELGLQMKVIDQTDWVYSTGVLFSSYRSEYDDYPNPTVVSAPCCGTLNPIVPVIEGERLGNFLAPVYVSTDENREPVFKDIYPDGIEQTSPNYIFDPTGDFAVVGNGLPDFELGWSQQLRFRGWELNAFFRGAFGHSLVNMSRAFYEPRRFFINNNYNLVDTELAVEDLRVSRYSSLYVEKASFFKLDNVTLARTFSLGTETHKYKLRISLTGQNLFVLTNYTGTDPEPIFEDLGATGNGGMVDISRANPLTPGIDRRYFYLPARTFVLGLGLTF